MTVFTALMSDETIIEREEEGSVSDGIVPGWFTAVWLLSVMRQAGAKICIRDKRAEVSFISGVNCTSVVSGAIWEKACAVVIKFCRFATEGMRITAGAESAAEADVNVNKVTGAECSYSSAMDGRG